MPKKLSKEDIEYREGVAMFNAWTKQNKKLEKLLNMLGSTTL